jgi:hypothetical protein
MKVAVISPSFAPSLAWLHGFFALMLLLAASPASAENQTLLLDGRGSYVELPSDLFTNLDQATVEVWAKWDALANYSRVFEFGRAWQSFNLFNDGTKSDLRFNIYPENASESVNKRFTITAFNLIRTNEWIHLAAVSGPGGMLLYANGRLVGRHPCTASLASIPGTHTNYLGRGLAGIPGDLDFRGEIDELRVWDHRRTVAEIQENMFKRLSGHESGLVHLWNFDDGTANDACSAAGRGTLHGHARIVPSDLGLVAETAVAAVPATATMPSATSAAAVAPADSGPGAVAWWIAGTLSALVLLVAWLVLMLRRSGVGSDKLMATASTGSQLTAGSAAPAQLPPASHAELKERALAELTDFAKQSLVQGLYSQRAALLAAQKQAQVELAELEARLMALRLPERIQAYETRIAELEAQLETRGEEFRELTQTTIKVLRQRLEAERVKLEKPSRFN